MRSKVRTQLVRCPSHNRDVEVTYTVSGSWLERKYELADCPALFDGGASCDRRCWPSLSHPPRYLLFAMSYV
jgi:hypothetical protein